MANIVVFFVKEHTAARLQFADGILFAQFIEAYASTIDTAAWVALLLLFELETYILNDEQFTPRLVLSLHVLRATCYVVIVYAFYGYVVNLVTVSGATPLAGHTDLCTLVHDGFSYAVNLDEYELLTAANCSRLSNAAQFYQFPGFAAVVDPAGHLDIARLAWLDVINAAVWLLVVTVLEIDVRLQERRLLEGFAYRISATIKFLLYNTLLAAAIYWGIKGDFVNYWDAFLWLFAFVFIELNIVQWRAERRGQAG